MRSLFILLISVILFCNIGHSQVETNILVMSKTNGYRHKSIDSGIEALWKMSRENNWTITFTEDSTHFNYENLRHYNVILFLNTTLDILGEKEQLAFQKFINNGGGYVGIHAAADTEYDWEFYKNMLGVQFASHPKTQKATMKVYKNDPHPAVAHLSNDWTKIDEWYNFKEAVPTYTNVLLELDESSYKGKRMGIKHPIAWYHTYEGGRIFYTGLGHTPESFQDIDFIKHLLEGIKWAAGVTNISAPSEWTNLLDPDLSQWDKFIGIPHSSVELEGVEKSDDIKKGTPLGLNNDPLEVFKMNDEGVLVTSGEIYGGLSTKQEYSNYHLKLAYKWGDKKWEPRLDKLRDAGLLYHCTGVHGAFWHVWMRCLELQIQEGETGDLYALAGANAMVRSKAKDGEKFRNYDPKGNKEGVGSHYGKARLSRSESNEKAHGEWNSVELYVVGSNAVHVVNGKVVNIIEDAHIYIDDEKRVLDVGKIQLQSEGATIFYKDVMIKSISDFPKEIKAMIK